MSKYKFSLVLATKDRTAELERFLYHLHQQSFRDFELIVVDQNPDDRLVPILAVYEQDFPVLHIKTEPKGVSQARNLGRKYTRGDIIGFPDDDCWYAPDLLEQLAAFFDKNPQWDGISGRGVGLDGQNAAGNFDTDKGPVNKWNVWRRGITFAMFYRRDILTDILFDEDVGPGANTIWGATEETDYLLQMITRGFKILYDPDVAVYHPEPLKEYDQQVMKRAYTYGCGMGRTLRKHRYPVFFLLWHIMRPAAGIIVAMGTFNPGRMRYHYQVCRGRIYGCRHSK